MSQSSEGSTPPPPGPADSAGLENTQLVLSPRPCPTGRPLGMAQPWHWPMPPAAEQGGWKERLSVEAGNVLREGKNLNLSGLPRPQSQGAAGQECWTGRVSGKDAQESFV